MGKLKSSVRGIKKTAKWAVPVFTDVDKQLDVALSDKNVARAYESYAGDPNTFVNELRRDIEWENRKNSRLRYLANAMDVGNKALVPVDAVLAGFNILAGVGTAAEGVITLGKLPGYLGYDAYYLGKTHDMKGAVENIIWEATTWLVPGSLPHLINHYSQQADRYAVKKGIEKFLERKKESGKVVSMNDYRKDEDLESLSEVA